MVIPGASHTDLYDRKDIIPFAEIETFFNEYLRKLLQLTEIISPLVVGRPFFNMTDNKPTGILTRELRSDYFYDFHIYSRAVGFGAVCLS